MEERKTCIGCGELRPITEFYQSKGRPHGQCKDCIKARQRAIREQRPGYRPALPPRDESGKTCPKCLVRKPIDQFIRPQSGKVGTYCDPCATAKGREAKLRLAESITRQRRERYARPVDPTEVRRCPRCHEDKPRAQFAAGGKSGYCKPCRAAYARDRNRAHRDRRREQKWGLTADDFAALLAKQGGACAICGGTAITNGRWISGDGNDLHVDHDHSTGRVRGLLCNRCNVTLGLMDDDPNRLIRAAEYIKNPPAQ